MKPYYDSDGCTIYHGDALEVLGFLATGERCDLVITDPPYVIGAVSAGTLSSKSGGWADMMNSAHWFTAWYGAASRVTHYRGMMWTFLNWRTLPVVMRAASHGRMVHTVPPAELKAWATGRGNANKEDMMTAARDRGWGGDDHNEADAFLLWHMWGRS